MRQPLIRNGKLVGSPMEGIDSYDLTKLSEDQIGQLKSVMAKIERGSNVSMSDAAALVKVREVARNHDATSRISASLRRLRQLLDGGT